MSLEPLNPVVNLDSAHAELLSQEAQPLELVRPRLQPLLPTHIENPVTEQLLALNSDEKIQRIQEHFTGIMNLLGLDLNDDSLQGTPRRIAKMYVNELFSGLNPNEAPNLSLFDNTYGYTEMLVGKGIRLQSMCEHHFMPIVGTATVAYIPHNKVIGLSKLNRVVEYFASRPQVQERLTRQVAEYLMDQLGTEDVAVHMESKHFCVLMRGIKDPCAETATSSLHGKFQQSPWRQEFMQHVFSKPA